MRKNTLLITMLVSAAYLMAAPVPLHKSERIANFFFHEHGGQGNLTFVESNTFNHLRLYVGTEGKGFVIMSSDDRVFPVLGYSANNIFDINDMGANTASWLEDYDDQIEWNITNGNEASHEVTAEWERLEMAIPAPQQAPVADSTLNTANLLTTTWKQSTYYNDQCPYDSLKEKHALTGCVATAMGQIMKYWGFPIRGVGSKTYQDETYGRQSVVFADTVFNYAAMPDHLDANSSATQVNAVAMLLYRCGVSVEMSYGTKSSGASTISNGSFGYPSAENAFREFFKYKNTLHRVALGDYDDAGWVNLMKNEINNGRPVQYSAKKESGSGHSFVCCGYDNNDMLYFNWGWGGYCDGNYAIGQLNPGDSKYNVRNMAIIGLEPDTSGATTTVAIVTSDNETAGTVSGSGTYNSYNHTVTISAYPNPGYLFAKWNGNNTFARYQFLANGDTAAYTAYFDKIADDTVGYCFDSNLECLGGSLAQRFWGIRLDSFVIAPNRKLTDVSAFISESGMYMVHIFQGNDIKKYNQIHSDTVNIASNQKYTWVTIPLSKSISINRTKNLWIVLETTCSGHPMTVSSYRGNYDGAYCSRSLYNNWYNYVKNNKVYISFQIRGIFEYDPTAASDEDVSAEHAMDIYTEANSIIVVNKESQQVMIYDTSGRLVADKVADSNHESFIVATGIYFVRVDNQTVKVVIK